MGFTAAALAFCLVGQVPDRPCVVLVIGAAGSPEYGAEFRRWADSWQRTAEQGPAEVVRIGEQEGDGTDRDRLKEVLTARTGAGLEPLWLVLIGHGTSDRRDAKFNLRGPDVSDADLAGWLSGATRPVVVVSCSSSSGPFLHRLSGPNRVIVTATRSGDESNFSRFGGYLAEAIGRPDSDLDRDGQVSLLEAYLSASGRVEEYYRAESRLATEHALLDDNGDAAGTPADWFRGLRAVKRAQNDAPVDGVRAHQLHLVPGDRESELPAEVRRRRDELEQAVAALREQKDVLGEEAYYARLEELLIELSRLAAGSPDR